MEGITLEKGYRVKTIKYGNGFMKEFLYDESKIWWDSTNGKKEWYDSESQLHRDDGPAIECLNGDREWYVHGQRHRINGPAIERSGKTILIWYNYGLKHRDGGEPAVRTSFGYEWYQNGVEYKKSIISNFIQ